MSAKLLVCPHCNAPKTNRGTLATHGRYTGFACRTWVADYGTRQRSEVCKSREAFNKLNPPTP